LATDLFDSTREVANPATEVTNLAADVSNSAREVANLATESTKPTKHAGPTMHNLTTCTRVASHRQPPKCWRTTPLTITRS
jgi:methyl-accepting chemotaxis protein